jgi:uncharacterized protein YkwD
MRSFAGVVLASIAFLVAPGAAQAGSAISFQTAGEQQVLVLLNQIRVQHGLTPFTASPPLRSAARAHSADMLQRGYFDHDSPTETWDVRIFRYLRSPLIGEDIAWGQGAYGTPAGIVGQWMRSPVHRAIILTAGLHRIGVGLALGTFVSAPGAVMATADFAA